jgi:arylsulfatase A-like enzyme
MLERLLRAALPAVCLVLFGCSSDREDTAPAITPEAAAVSAGPVRNLVLICTDTVRADAFFGLGAGQRDALHPWESGALVFRQASSPAPWTLPSVASALTGLWPVQHGIGQLPGKMKNLARSFPTDFYEGTPLLAQTAAEQGYKTAIFTRNGWTFDDWRSKGLPAGFNDNVKFAHNVYGIGETVWPRMVEQWRELFVRHTSEAPAVHFIHLMEAHDWHLEEVETLDARLATLGPGRRKLFLDLAPEQTCRDEHAEMCKRWLVYLHAVTAMREAIATVLENLEADGLLEATLVIAFSDHGEEFDDHKGDDRPETSAGNTLTFGHGHSLYQEQLHVPLMIWHPGLDGREIEQPVSLIDIAPTAARWLGFEFVPGQWQGHFLDEYLGGAAETGTRVIFASGISIGEPQISARQGPKKGIWYTLSDINRYFDLDMDPLEQQPVDSMDLVMRFDGHFLDYVQSRPDKKIKPTRFTEKHIERLKSIGYLQGVEVDESHESRGGE